MQVTIINGGLKDDRRLQDSLKRISSELEKRGFNIKVFELSEMTIKNCIGCFTCWTKSPGICVYDDDMKKILIEYIKSNVVIFASTILSGFVTSLLRKATERLLPLFLPYLTIINKRFNHILRYDNYPYLVLLLDDSNRISSEDIEMINDIYRQANLNYKFTRLTERPIGEIASEIEDLCRLT